MSSCSVEIRLDAGKMTYDCGDTVRGTVRAEADIAAGLNSEIEIPITVHAPDGSGEAALGPEYDHDEVLKAQHVSLGGRMARNILGGLPAELEYPFVVQP